MTNRDHFIAALDADPSDQVTRLVFADWLEENGEGQADTVLCAGLRWLSKYRRFPGQREKFWTFQATEWWNATMTHHDWVPHVKFREGVATFMDANATSDRLWLFKTRHAAEVSLAEALWEAWITQPSTFVPI